MALTLIVGYKVTAQDVCETLARQGGIEVREGYSTEEVMVSLVNWFRSRQFRSFAEARSASASANVPLDGVMIGVTGDYGESYWSRFQSDIQRFNASNIRRRSEIATRLMTFNETYLSLLRQCVEKADNRVHWYVLPTDNSFEYTLVLFYALSTPIVPTSRVKVAVSNAIINESGQSASEVEIEVVGGQRKRIGIRRVDSAIMVVRVNAANEQALAVGGDDQFSVPAVRPVALAPTSWRYRVIIETEREIDSKGAGTTGPVHFTIIGTKNQHAFTVHEVGALSAGQSHSVEIVSGVDLGTPRRVRATVAARHSDGTLDDWNAKRVIVRTSDGGKYRTGLPQCGDGVGCEPNCSATCEGDLAAY